MHEDRHAVAQRQRRARHVPTPRAPEKQRGPTWALMPCQLPLTVKSLGLKSSRPSPAPAPTVCAVTIRHTGAPRPTCRRAPRPSCRRTTRRHRHTDSGAPRTARSSRPPNGASGSPARAPGTPRSLAHVTFAVPRSILPTAEFPPTRLRPLPYESESHDPSSKSAQHCRKPLPTAGRRSDRLRS